MIDVRSQPLFYGGVIEAEWASGVAVLRSDPDRDALIGTGII